MASRKYEWQRHPCDTAGEVTDFLNDKNLPPNNVKIVKGTWQTARNNVKEVYYVYYAQIKS